MGFLSTLYISNIFLKSKERNKISVCICQWCLCSSPPQQPQPATQGQRSPHAAHTHACSAPVWPSEHSFCPAAKTVHPFEPPPEPLLQEGNGKFTEELINYGHFQRFRAQNDFSGDVLLLFFTAPADFVVAGLFYFQFEVLCPHHSCFQASSSITGGRRETKESAWKGKGGEMNNEHMLMALLE